MAQFPFQYAILKVDSKKKGRVVDALYFFAATKLSMATRQPRVRPPQGLSALRKKITELVAQNAVPMVQQAIDAVREGGQYQAMKYLFEMIGLYPGVAPEDDEKQDSLAQLLLAQLGLTEDEPAGVAAKRSKHNPVK